MSSTFQQDDRRLVDGEQAEWVIVGESEGEKINDRAAGKEEKIMAAIAPPLRRRQAAIMTPYDVRRPWHNVYGFPLLSGRLAAGESLTLVCRADEQELVITRLNTLLQSCDSLQRVQAMIDQLEARTTARLAQLIEVETMPIGMRDTDAILVRVEQTLAASMQPPTLHERLACLLEPELATDKIVGILRTVMDLRAYATGLSRRGHRVLYAWACEADGQEAQSHRPPHPMLHRYAIHAKLISP